ncbi:DUF302 domain-containing protein [Thermococcus sp. 5-4]|uniref:DUF302 domain-containing protein n=1 Tax=Thermococcus sp. 5-4 TaxID=2008440 RepID=UPI000B4A3CE2|nr:DUF302 domain-containing protein [Thermococcus sp. 5-4]ASA77641.1 hypothetical protein CDI07_04815 [Thermococcus sp. 5-4]
MNDEVNDMERMRGKMADMERKGGCKGHHGRMKEKDGYMHVKESGMGFDETVERIREGLNEEGFGVISEVRVDRLFKEKLGVDMEPYVILGACNPRFSSQLIGIDINSGSFLPCNMLVYVKDGKTHVGLLLPTKAMSVTKNDELLKVTGEVEKILLNVIEKI